MLYVDKFFSLSHSPIDGTMNISLNIIRVHVVTRKIMLQIDDDFHENFIRKKKIQIDWHNSELGISKRQITYIPVKYETSPNNLSLPSLQVIELIFNQI